jgi:outer membrane protein, heavy metal efflux system
MNPDHRCPVSSLRSRTQDMRGVERKRRWVGVALLTLLPACASAPPASPLDPAITAHHFMDRTLSDARLLSQAAPCTGDCAWSLDRLTLAAWSFDPSLAEARAALARVEAESMQSRQRPNPTLSVGSEYNRDAASGTSPWLLSAALEFTIETAGKRGIRGDIVEAAVEEQRIALASQAGTVRQRVRQARLDLARTAADAELTSRDRTLQEERAELLRHRLQQGALARPESYRGERDAVMAQAEYDRRHAAEAQAHAALAAALSVPPRALEGVALTPLPAFDANDPLWTAAALRTLGVDNRLDLAQALAAYRRADAGLRLEIAKRTPDITIGPGLIFDQGDHKFSLATTLIAPLLDRNRHNIAVASAARDEAAAHVVSVQTAAFAEIESARVRLSSAVETLRVLDAKRQRAQDDLGQVRRRLQAGAIDRVEWIDAQSLDLQYQRQRADAQAEVYAAIGQLETAVQRPLWPASQLQFEHAAHEDAQRMSR